MSGVEKRKVILVTDGDDVAKQVIEEVAKKVGGRCISRSGGNPTPLSGEQIVSQILKAPYDPVFVMFDDNGNGETGRGEEAMEYVAKQPELEVLGVVAVASNTPFVNGVDVDICVDANGNVTEASVDKDGHSFKGKHAHVNGDTVDVLSRINVPIVVGVGDIGKMEGRDHIRYGAPITTKAVEVILERCGFSNHDQR